VLFRIHAYPIDRDEATELGLNIERTTDTLEKAIHQLYEDYATTMKLGQPFHPDELLGGREFSDVSIPGAFVESTDLTYEFTFAGKVQKSIRNNQPALDLNLNTQVWIKKEEK